MDTDFFGNLAQHLVLVNRTDQLVQLGKPARGLRQLPFVGVGFGSVLLFVTAEEFLSCTLFIGKYKAHLGANVRKNKLVQNLDLNIVACTSSLPEFGIRTAGEVLTVIGTRVCSLVSGVIPFDIHLVPAIGAKDESGQRIDISRFVLFALADRRFHLTAPVPQFLCHNGFMRIVNPYHILGITLDLLFVLVGYICRFQLNHMPEVNWVSQNLLHCGT